LLFRFKSRGKAPQGDVDGIETFSLYLTTAYKILIIFYLVGPVIGILSFAVIISHEDPTAPIFLIVVWPMLMVAWFWYFVLSTPYRTVFAPDGDITFISILRRKKGDASEIVSIKPAFNYMGFLFVRSSRGKVRLLNQFDRFHEFISKLKSMNPTLTVRGC
jgi:hypothetical protein